MKSKRLARTIAEAYLVGDWEVAREWEGQADSTGCRAQVEWHLDRHYARCAQRQAAREMGPSRPFSPSYAGIVE